jgi:hypothetical protein
MGSSAADFSGEQRTRRDGPVLYEVAVDPAESDADLAQAAAAGSFDPSEFLNRAALATSTLRGLPPVTNPHAADALEALRTAVQAATWIRRLPDLADFLSAADELRARAERSAAQASADFVRDPEQRRDAQAAQVAAAATEEIAAATTLAVSVASRPALSALESSSPVRRTLRLSGLNLSPGAAFEIDAARIPSPWIDVRVETLQGAGPFARVLQLLMDPATFTPEDERLYLRWFGSPGSHVLAILNPDGGWAEVPFQLPAGAARLIEQE